MLMMIKEWHQNKTGIKFRMWTVTSLTIMATITLLSLQLLSLLSIVQSRLVSLNPKFPLPERTSGPKLWPQPERYLVNHNFPPYRLSSDIQIKIMANAHPLLKKCDIIQHQLNKYRMLMNDFMDEVARMQTSGSCLLQRQQLTNMTKHDEHGFLNEVHLFVDDLPKSAAGNGCRGHFPDYVDGATSANNESYSIEVQPKNGKAILYAKTVWGMIRAMETFSQLLYVRPIKKILNGSHRENCLEILINVGHVWDQPRFRYRSLMIDTARHFIPFEMLVKNLDAMAYNKLNIFHWHLNDDQSFPFDSETFRNFSRLASYDRNHYYNGHQIRMIINEARLRGIQVILELDTPAHNQALGKVFPDIMSRCGNDNYEEDNSSSNYKQKTFSKMSSSNIINPSTEATYRILQELMSEMRSLMIIGEESSTESSSTAGNRIHLGMDDVTYDCWSSDSSIQQFMSLNEIPSYEKLEQYHLHRMVEMTARFKLRPIIWQDPFDKDVDIPNGTIVQIWKDHHLLHNDPREWRYHMRRLLRHNHSVILSACYFLNVIEYGQDWKDLYHCDPHDFINGNQSEDEAENLDKLKHLVLGGEACLWTEYIDGTNFLSRTWPRASAVAERLWTQRTNIVDNAEDDDDVYHRLDAQRCRLLRRGIPAQPISTGYCEHFDWNDPNHWQNSMATEDDLLNKPLPEAEFKDSKITLAKKVLSPTISVTPPNVSSTMLTTTNSPSTTTIIWMETTTKKPSSTTQDNLHYFQSLLKNKPIEAESSASATKIPSIVSTTMKPLSMKNLKINNGRRRGSGGFVQFNRSSSRKLDKEFHLIILLQISIALLLMLMI